MITPPHSITARDLFLPADLSDDDARAYLASRGFRDAEAADEHLQGLALTPPPSDRVDHDAELDTLLGTGTDTATRIDRVKRFKRREYLGVAARDLLG